MMAVATYMSHMTTHRIKSDESFFISSVGLAIYILMAPLGGKLADRFGELVVVVVVVVVVG